MTSDDSGALPAFFRPLWFGQGLLTAPVPLLVSPVRGIRTVADAERMAGDPAVVPAGV